MKQLSQNKQAECRRGPHARRVCRAHPRRDYSGSSSRPLPVSSRDDETAALANRIAAVADVVGTIDGRLARMESFLPPRPVLPPSPIYPALVSVQDAAAALLASAGGIACGTSAAGAPSDSETSADDDGRAEDTSSEGLVGQLAAVATVLGQANPRLSGIAALVGTSSGSAGTDAAGAVWAQRRRSSTAPPTCSKTPSTSRPARSARRASEAALTTPRSSITTPTQPSRRGDVARSMRRCNRSSANKGVAAGRP
jgi:hypothetical protein